MLPQSCGPGHQHAQARRSDVPPFVELVDRGNWSLGEAFDCVLLVYYALQSEQQVCFVWVPSESPGCEHSELRGGLREAAVAFDVFDQVVEAFLSEIGMRH